MKLKCLLKCVPEALPGNAEVMEKWVGMTVLYLITKFESEIFLFSRERISWATQETSLNCILNTVYVYYIVYVVIDTQLCIPCTLNTVVDGHE